MISISETNSGVRRFAQNDLSAPARCVQVGRFRFPKKFSDSHNGHKDSHMERKDSHWTQKIHTRNPVQGADREVRRASSSELPRRSAHGDSRAANIF